MPPRPRRRALVALMATALGGTALVVGPAAPAFASAHHAADGSPAQAKATPSATPLLGLNLRGQSLSVNAAAISLDTGTPVRGLTGGSPSTAPTPSSAPVPAPRPLARSATKPPTTHSRHPVRRHRVVRHHASSRGGAIHRVAAGYRNPVRTVDHRTSRTAHRGSRSGQHQTRHEVAGKRHSLGSRLLQDVARPGSPAQLLTLLVIMCAIGTAFVVSLARRKDPKPVRVRNRSEER